MRPRAIIVAVPGQKDARRLAQAVDALPDFSVVAVTRSLSETYAEVEARQPAAVLITHGLTRQPEFEVMRALFSALDIRWLVVGDPAETTAMAPAKGSLSSSAGLGQSDLFGLPSDATVAEMAAQLRSLTRNATASLRVASAEPVLSGTASDLRRLVLIGASTGGVEALLSVLSSFDRNSPATVIVQHTGNGFGASLASLLDRHCRAEVRLAEDGAPLQPGKVLIAAGTRRHVELARDGTRRIVLVDGPQVSGHCPSIDRLFRSALGRARDTSAALLTGMGRDGAEGLLALRRAGARTITQDAATSVVYGMPRVAAELGAATDVLPLQSIGTALIGPRGAGVAGAAAC